MENIIENAVINIESNEVISDLSYTTSNQSSVSHQSVISQSSVSH